VTGAPFAVASDLSVTGYVKNFFTVFDAPLIRSAIPLPDEPLDGAVSNRIRIDTAYRPNPWLSVHASYNVLPRIQDPSLFERPPNLSGFRFPTYRFADLDDRLYPDENDDVGSFGIFQNLDRAVVTLRTPLADLFLGRQAIAWGSARSVNPTDILIPFPFDELDTEDRIGVDAVRVRVPLGRMGEFDGGYVTGDDFDIEESAFFLRTMFSVARTDVAPLLVGFRENLLVGIDIARPIGGAGAWLEAAYVFADALGGDRAGSGNDYLRATLGADYALTGTLYGFIEYHISSAGAGDANRYLVSPAEPAYTDGAVYLLGRHYLIPGLAWQITPLLSLGGQFMTNLNDPSLLLAPSIEYNVAEDIYLAVGGFIGAGRSPESMADPGVPIRFRSEFGAYPDLYFSSFRVYF
jgi:hypothetical protein